MVTWTSQLFPPWEQRSIHVSIPLCLTYPSWLVWSSPPPCTCGNSLTRCFSFHPCWAQLELTSEPSYTENHCCQNWDSAIATAVKLQIPAKGLVLLPHSCQPVTMLPSLPWCGSHLRHRSQWSIICKVRERMLPCSMWTVKTKGSRIGLLSHKEWWVK